MEKSGSWDRALPTEMPGQQWVPQARGATEELVTFTPEIS